VIQQASEYKIYYSTFESGFIFKFLKTLEENGKPSNISWHDRHLRISQSGSVQNTEQQMTVEYSDISGFGIRTYDKSSLWRASL
jgi:hypothetical protein